MPTTKVQGRVASFLDTSDLLRKWERERGLLSVPLHLAIFKSDITDKNRRNA